MPVPQLPADLWVAIVTSGLPELELKWVRALRVMNSTLANALDRDRVYAYCPDTKTFVRELRLLDTYNQRKMYNGRMMYSRAYNMLFLRKSSYRRGEEQDEKLTELLRELLEWFTVYGVLMPAEFCGFVSRINSSWQRDYLERHGCIDLETQLRKIHSGMTIEKDGWEAITVDIPKREEMRRRKQEADECHKEVEAHMRARAEAQANQ